MSWYWWRINENTPSSVDDRVSYEKVAATYSPTWWGSTIGDGELNFSVRNGKRWILTAITATICFWEKITQVAEELRCSSRVHLAVLSLSFPGQFLQVPITCLALYCIRLSSKPHPEEDVGLLVPLGFDITAFTPAAYRRGSLPRPSKDVSSWRRLRA